ncbi:hypothetical protein BKA63DRAFT_428156 [Paraphoma chrysanthemicola]|nr:hypothetical protein BKA63DRAFT_428156 [Paraphoma chrysanthemicola]
MKPSLSFIAVVLGSVGVALASPVQSSPLFRRDDVGASVGGIGQCPLDCWNEAAATAGCDPNADDVCLCGPFFDDVAACTGDTCGVADNLGKFTFKHLC